MGVQVKCPSCGHLWWAKTKAQTQESKCRVCHYVLTVGPHERRVGKRKDPATGETVTTIRDTPVKRNNDWLWFIVFGVICLVLGWFWICMLWVGVILIVFGWLAMPTSRSNSN